MERFLNPALVLRCMAEHSLERRLAGEGPGDNYKTPTPSYTSRSRELSGFFDKITSFMKGYQNPLTTGGAPKAPDLLIDSYTWGFGSVAISLRESSGFHGGDIITVREQVLIDSSDTSKPRSLGIIAHEGGNGKLHAYAVFSLNGNSMYKDTTDDYELPHERNAAEVQQNKTPINVQGFLSDIYSHRNTLTLMEIRPKVSLTSHLRRKNTTQPAQP